MIWNGEGTVLFQSQPWTTYFLVHLSLALVFLCMNIMQSGKAVGNKSMMVHVQSGNHEKLGLGCVMMNRIFPLKKHPKIQTLSTYTINYSIFDKLLCSSPFQSAKWLWSFMSIMVRNHAELWLCFSVRLKSRMKLWWSSSSLKNTNPKRSPNWILSR